MILLTRPYQNSLELAQILGKKNCLIEPMLEIKQLKFNITNNHQAVVITSKNSAIPNSTAPIIKIPEYGNSAKEVLDYCLKTLNPKAGKILYLSGDVVSLDIAEELRKKGFDAERVISYKQIPSVRLSADFHSYFTKITVASFFSEQTLLTFSKHLRNHDLSKIICVCISKKLAETARKMSWKKIIVTKAPNLASMIAAIQEASLDS